MFAIVPKGNPDDVWAAGLDGNHFDTREEAEEEIPRLRELGGDFDHEWDVIETPTPEGLRRWIIWDPRDGNPRREDGRIISDGILGRIGVGNVYLNSYAQYAEKDEVWPLRAHRRLDVGESVNATFSLSGQKGNYLVIRVR